MWNVSLLRANNRFRTLGLFALAALSGTLLFAPAPTCAAEPEERFSAKASSEKEIEFFESRIRPILVDRCYTCHSQASEELGGSLFLDSGQGMRTGGDSGPAIVPGDAQASLLISALRYESSEMPPDEPLSAKVIQDFEQWIDQGAVDPRNKQSTNADGTAAESRQKEIHIEAGRDFWAFRPIGEFIGQREPMQVRAGANRSSSPTHIDRLLRNHWNQAGIQEPNGLAAPAVRLRRLHFDLTGLPPSETLMASWVRDPSPSNWQRIVDQLLASPEYAQHWARHWMDVARYSDSNGSDFNATHHEAWRYRDYLIRSMAIDRPWNEMIHQQIAGDLLPYASDQQRHDNVVASTFLMLGTKMLSERNKAKLALDVVDEQIDTVGRAFLGMTLGCARCHDHKFDPIPTEDYYALAGIFKSTVTINGESQKYVSTWNRVPLPTTDEHRQTLKSFAADESALKNQIKGLEKRLKQLQTSSENTSLGIVLDDADATKKGSWKSSTLFKGFVGKGYIHDNNVNKGDASVVFKTRVQTAGDYEVRFAYSPNPSRAARVPVTIDAADTKHDLFVDQRKVEIAPIWSSLGTFRFTPDKDVVITVSNRNTAGYVIVDAFQLISSDSKEQAEHAESHHQNHSRLISQTQQELDDQRKRLKKLQAKRPRPLPVAMAPADVGTERIADSPVHIRGEVKNLGKIVPRGFLQVCSESDPSIRQPRGSGRLELASWLTDPDNPLVTRVFVNRVWMHLMGQGIVRTVDNFGARGERPTHPILLDTLAIDFARGGWRLKPLIRRIVLSESYSRSSAMNDQAYQLDPENRLLWRAHRKRLTAESIRDSMLSIAGVLDHRGRVEPMKGRGTLVSSNNANSKASFAGVSEACRTIYLPVVRSYVPALLSGLDGADPDLLVGRRPTTNVPGQALVLINSPDVNTWALKSSQRLLKDHAEFDDRLIAAYQRCFARDPDHRDRAIATAFFDRERQSEQRWHEWIAAMFASTEFRLLD